MKSIISFLLSMMTVQAVAMTSGDVKACYDASGYIDPQGVLKFSNGDWDKFTDKGIYSVRTKSKGSLPSKQFHDETGYCFDAHVSDKYPDHYVPELKDDTCLTKPVTFSKVTDLAGLNKVVYALLEQHAENLKRISENKKKGQVSDEQYQEVEAFKSNCGNLDALSPSNQAKLEENMNLVREIQGLSLRDSDASAQGSGSSGPGNN